MTLPTLIFIVLICAAVAVAIVQTLQTGCSRGKKTFFILVRILIGTLLLLAFLEPVLTLHRLHPSDRRCMLLVDASSSMPLFSADSSTNGIIDKIQLMGVARGHPVPVWLFGDSLREKSARHPYVAHDRKSDFPSQGGNAALRDAGNIIIISDGNWSNGGPVADDFAGKQVGYLALGQTKHPATIGCTAPDTVMVSAGSGCTVDFDCYGSATAASAIIAGAFVDSMRVCTDTVAVAAGQFSSPVRLRLPPVAAGVHLFLITLVNLHDTVSCQQYLLCRALPSSFAYTITSGRPSLDERYLRLALARTPAFTSTRHQPGLGEQVRFILHAPAAAMPPAPVVPVYIGCLPATAAHTDTVTSFFLPVDVMNNPLDRLPLPDMPPVTAIRTDRTTTIVTTWLSARTVRGDTLPVLFDARYRGRPLIACVFDGLWKWDFLPLSHQQGETETQQFSRSLLAITQESLMATTTDTLLVWPVGQATTFDSLKLAVVAPRQASSDTASMNRIKCSIIGKNSALRYDTMLNMPPHGALSQFTSLPPLPPDDYFVCCTLATSTRVYQSNQPFKVVAIDGELLANGQNTVLLKELGRPIDVTDTAQIAAFLTDRGNDLHSEPVTQRFPLRRSWLILGALFMLFGIEWIVRRIEQLD